MKNFYEILGVPEDADQDSIRKAFRALAKIHHPDMEAGDDDKFREINHVYNVLSNPDSRRDYDRTLANFRSGNASFDSYTSQEVFDVQGKHLKKLLAELMRHTELTRVRVKYEGKTLFDMPISTAVGITVLGFMLAPIATILINVGLERYFQVEVTNTVMENYEKAVETHNGGDLMSAEKRYKEILESSEYFLPARLNLGMLYRQRGENKLAMEQFRMVLEVAPFGEIGQIAKTNLEALRGF